VASAPEDIVLAGKSYEGALEEVAAAALYMRAVRGELPLLKRADENQPARPAPPSSRLEDLAGGAAGYDAVRFGLLGAGVGAGGGLLRGLLSKKKNKFRQAVTGALLGGALGAGAGGLSDALGGLNDHPPAGGGPGAPGGLKEGDPSDAAYGANRSLFNRIRIPFNAAVAPRLEEARRRYRAAMAAAGDDGGLQAAAGADRDKEISRLQASVGEAADSSATGALRRIRQIWNDKRESFGPWERAKETGAEADLLGVKQLLPWTDEFARTSESGLGGAAGLAASGALGLAGRHLAGRAGETRLLRRALSSANPGAKLTQAVGVLGASDPAVANTLAAASRSGGEHLRLGQGLGGPRVLSPSGGPGGLTWRQTRALADAARADAGRVRPGLARRFAGAAAAGLVPYALYREWGDPGSWRTGAQAVKDTAARYFGRE
jgi:hypothetical protein